MKGSKLITFIFTANLLLVSCRFKTNTILGNSKKPVVAIANLANGNYHYCSDPNPNPNEDKLDGHRYCFTFTKTDASVVGHYSYRAPKDVPHICVEGKVKNNQVVGIGYEGLSPGAKQYTNEELASITEPLPSKKLSYWDDQEEYQGGFNLKVASLSYYRYPPIVANGLERFYVTERYGVIEFDLSGFEAIEKDDLPDYKKCP